MTKQIIKIILFTLLKNFFVHSFANIGVVNNSWIYLQYGKIPMAIRQSNYNEVRYLKRQNLESTSKILDNMYRD